MSPPPAKDDKAADKPAGKDAKKPWYQSAWIIVGGIILGGAAIVVGLYVIGAYIDPAASAMQQINNGFERLNEQFHEFSSNFTEMLMTIAKFLLLPLLIVLVVRWASSSGKKAEPH